MAINNYTSNLRSRVLTEKKLDRQSNKSNTTEMLSK